MTPNTQTAVQKTVLDKVFTPEYVAGSTRQIPKHVSIDRIVTAFRAVAMAKPDVFECSATSIRLAFIKSVQSGLIPDGRQAHLIPRRVKGVKELMLQFDWKGVADLVRRSGEVKSIHADVVYENDFFSYEYGTDEHLRHRPATKSLERGLPTEVYSLVTLKDGTKEFMVMSVAEVNEVRDKFSQGYRYAKEEGKDNPWISSWGEMAKKTAFLRHSKSLPLSADLREQMNNDADLSPRNSVEVMEPARNEIRMGAIPIMNEPEQIDAPPVSTPPVTSGSVPESKTVSTPPTEAAKAPKAKEKAKTPPVADKAALIAQINDRMAQRAVDPMAVWTWFVTDGAIPQDTASWDELTSEQLQSIDNRLNAAMNSVKGEIL